MLSKRQSQILKLIIDTYIESAEPVGSKYIADLLGHSVSSATIRNEMSFLEEYGFLTKAHTSSGRVPIDKGYREYVDNLISLEEINRAERRDLTKALQNYVYENGNFIEAATEILSYTTGMVTISVLSKSNKSYLERLKIIYMEPGRALVVSIVSSGVAHNRFIRISELFAADDLEKIEKILESNLQGINLNSLSFEDMKLINLSKNVDAPAVEELLYEIYVSIKQANELDVNVNGLENLMRLPEFDTSSKIINIYNALDRDGDLINSLDRLNDNNNEEDFTVLIGDEIEIADLNKCTLISAAYNLGDDLHGQISLIGPKRMNYELLIPKVGFIREAIKDELLGNEK